LGLQRRGMPLAPSGGHRAYQSVAVLQQPSYLPQRLGQRFGHAAASRASCSLSTSSRLVSFNSVSGVSSVPVRLDSRLGSPGRQNPSSFMIGSAYGPRFDNTVLVCSHASSISGSE